MTRTAVFTGSRVLRTRAPGSWVMFEHQESLTPSTDLPEARRRRSGRPPKWPKTPPGALPRGPQEAKIDGCTKVLGGFLPSRPFVLLVRTWGSPGPPGGGLGGLWSCLGAVLEASGAVLERRTAGKTRMRKSFQNLRQMNDSGLLGLSLECSWKRLEPCWRPVGGYLGPPRAPLTRKPWVFGT